MHTLQWHLSGIGALASEPIRVNPQRERMHFCFIISLFKLMIFSNPDLWVTKVMGLKMPKTHDKADLQTGCFCTCQSGQMTHPNLVACLSQCKLTTILARIPQILVRGDGNRLFWAWSTKILNKTQMDCINLVWTTLHVAAPGNICLSNTLNKGQICQYAKWTYFQISSPAINIFA